MSGAIAPMGLSALAERISAEHLACRTAYQDSLSHARACGELLIQAKAEVKHGSWLPWLAENTQIGERSARAYMQVARDWAVLEKSATVADLSFRDALRLLSAGDVEEGEPDIPILDAEVVAAPCAYSEGDRAVVASPSNVYHGLEVDVVGHEGSWVIGRVGGVEYPFQADELTPTDAPSEPIPIPVPAQAQRPGTRQLLEILGRVVDEVGDSLSADLLAEIQALLSQ